MEHKYEEATFSFSERSRIELEIRAIKNDVFFIKIALVTIVVIILTAISL